MAYQNIREIDQDIITASILTPISYFASNLVGLNCCRLELAGTTFMGDLSMEEFEKLIKKFEDAGAIIDQTSMIWFDPNPQNLEKIMEYDRECRRNFKKKNNDTSK